MKTVLVAGCSSGDDLDAARHCQAQGWSAVARWERLRGLGLDATKPE
jgi:hypothetical protein